MFLVNVVYNYILCCQGGCWLLSSMATLSRRYLEDGWLLGSVGSMSMVLVL